MSAKKRTLAFVMCILMIMTLLPFGAFAADTGDVVYGRYDENGVWQQGDYENGVWGEDNIVTSKTATPLGNDAYRIDLSIAVTTKKTEVPAGAAATVLVLDRSGSMDFCADCGNENRHSYDCKYDTWSSVESSQTRMSAAKEAANSFLDSYKGDKVGQGRYVAVVSFASDASTVCQWQDVSTAEGLAAVKSAISGIKAKGGTNTDAGLRQAASLLGSDTVKNIQSKDAILLTDGVPTFYGNGNYDDGTDGSPRTSYYAQQAASALKNTGADLYTVCFGATKDTDVAYRPSQSNDYFVGKVKVTEFLSTYIATSADKAYTADNTEGLQAAFKAITETIIEGITSGMVVKDSETEFVKMTSVPNEYVASGNGYEWTLADPVVTSDGDQTTYTYSVSYTVKLDTEKPGFVDGKYYPTNGVTTLYYKDADGNDKSIDLTVPGVCGEAPFNTVSYSYEGSLIPEGANAQLPGSADCRVNSTVPVAKAPSVAGYEFSGWTTTDAVVGADGSFTMPNKPVKFVGTWTKSDKLEYTVNYYLNGTDTPVANSKTVKGQTLDAEVTEEPVAIDGYTALAGQNGTITIAASGNVINFYYYKNAVVTANSDVVTYDGIEHSVSGFTCSENNAKFDLTVGATGIMVGEYDAKFAENTVGTVDATKQYIITEAKDGKLTINPIDKVTVTITGNNKTVDYNGAEQTVTGYTVSISNPLYKESDFTFNGNKTAGGTDADTYNMGLSIDQFTNNSNNFKTVEFVLNDGYITINKIDAEFAGESKTVAYNGQEQTITGITPSGLVDGHSYEGLTYKASGIDAGSYDGEFSGTAIIKDAQGNDVTKNYTVSTKIGALTIEQINETVTVTITGKTQTVTYDGDEHTVSGYTYTASSPLYTDKDFTYAEDVLPAAVGTNVGSYEMGLDAEHFINLNETNFANVKFVVNDGWLKIEKRPVTLTSASDSKIYDGKPLTNDTVTVGGMGFVKNDAVIFDVTGSQTATGHSENTFTYKAKDNTNLDNYDIKTEFGILNVDQLLETGEHFNYVIGYTDGTIRPNGNISRAEVATIFFRLLTDDARAEFDSVENNFKDVAAGSWYNRAISTLAKAGILLGDENGNFRPNDSITRAEMATIIARFDKLTETGKTFTDIKGHWAQEAIEMAATKGWLNGYPDGSFHPNNAITRAETFKMINRVLNRNVVSQKDLLLDDMNVWSDNSDPEAWFYYDVQEATNNHECERIDMSEHERWTKKLTDIDWASYQI